MTWYATASSPEGTVHDDTGRVIVPHNPKGADEGTMERAQLISAAPDLLEACEAAWVMIGTDCIARDLLRKAIAKARGECA
jgi:hypothetical protein